MPKNFSGVDINITTVPSRDDLLTAFGKATLKDRYLMPGESFQDLFARVAAYFADDQAHAERLYDAISQHWFMPSTPILSNGGTERGMPISCFLNHVDDSILGISDTWNESVHLASNGGGIGTYWGDVRGIDEGVGVVGKTSGIIPFIKVQDSLTLAISQGSLRRGSSAVYISDTHPELEEFLDIRRVKGDPSRRSLNIHHGVMLSDAFMEAVESGSPWNLLSPKDGSVRKTIDARTAWQKILTTRLETGEPYIVFSDTVDRHRPDVYKILNLKVKQSNLCSEISLTTGIDHLGKNRTAVCCLASLNWATLDQWFGNTTFLKDVACFLDNVMTDFINKTEHKPGFEKARYSAYRERSIGIGVMGFHTYLQAMNIPFESAMAQAMNLRLFKWLKTAGIQINDEAATERGPCPDAVDAGINQRWTHLYSIAPTASISIICGGVSPGVEPWPANVFTQKTLSGSFEVRNAELDAVIESYAIENEDGFAKQAWEQILADEGSVDNLTFLSDDERAVFRTFIKIDQRWVVTHAAVRAPYVCQMSSNNISVPADVHKRDLHLLHMKAWKDGVPSLYYLRSKSLQRGGKVSHMAGEMPEVNPKHEIVLQDRGEKLEPLDISYDVCLACQ